MAHSIDNIRSRSSASRHRQGTLPPLQCNLSSSHDVSRSRAQGCNERNPQVQRPAILGSLAVRLELFLELFHPMLGQIGCRSARTCTSASFYHEAHFTPCFPRPQFEREQTQMLDCQHFDSHPRDVASQCIDASLEVGLCCLDFWT